MTRGQIITLSVLGVVVSALVLVGVFHQKNVLVGLNNGEQKIKTVIPPREEAKTFGYSPEVPNDVVTTTISKAEAPASSNPALNTKMRFYDMKAMSQGFTPSNIAVKKGDTVQIDFTAVDGDYDLNFPYLGAYFSTVKKGETKKLPFDTSLSGTFIFECKSSCPASGRIQGTLIVLP